MVAFGETSSWVSSNTNKYRKWLEKATVKTRGNDHSSTRTDSEYKIDPR